MKSGLYNFTIPYNLPGVGYVQHNLKSGTYNLCEFRYVKLILYLKLVMFILI